MPSASSPSTAARFVGQSITRKEDKRLVTGHGQYVDDVVMPGMLHGAFLRSDLARATITRIDTSAAEAMPGVVAVFTAEHHHDQYGEAWHGMLGEAMVVPPPLAGGDVRYVGDPVAFVVAESRYLAEDACELIEVDYEPLPPVVDLAKAIEPDAPVLHSNVFTKGVEPAPRTPSNICSRTLIARGDTEAAIREAAAVGEAHVRVDTAH
ncbi:MAG TPA: xanthine dehydrogenase family protein molybdopterin-binding subunit, partial [Acidimicrobiia bacterium]|nr:xanthine dehydrogenase family protein molybdopterin-binding subunit [Acidimicrobiia bacterium]